jgi:2-phosphosulfolactate phosphatase
MAGRILSTASPFDQSEYEIRCEWGLAGVRALAPISDVVVIVDVLSFSTAVDVAVSRGAAVLPYRWNDGAAAEFAESKKALLAAPRTERDKYSLAPASLRSIPSGTLLVLPSPNGSTLSLSTGGTVTVAACIRNCEAVAARLHKYGERIAVIPAGEQWSGGALRPSVEDLIGAGAILAGLPGRRSPEAESAIAVFERFRHTLRDTIARSGSGKELVDDGFPEDVEMASEYASSGAFPVLAGDRYVSRER